MRDLMSTVHEDATIRRSGNGAVALNDGGATFALPPNDGHTYCNAQMDDATPNRRDAPNRPGARLSLRARFSHEAHALRGTAGFGFWNDPFAMGGSRGWAAPQVCWFFFASPRSNMAPVDGSAGCGWRAMVMDGSGFAFHALLPALPVAVLLMRNRRARRLLAPVASGAMHAQEIPLPVAMTEWHDYTIDWRTDGVDLLADGRLLLHSSHSPTGPLSLVVWMDNQFLVATMDGHFASGAEAVPATQWMEVGGLVRRSLGNK